MERYTLARITNLKGTEVLGGKYILYTLTENFPFESHDTSFKLPELISTYLSIARKESRVLLSTKPNEEFISFSIGDKKTATLKLEELLDEEKREVERAILQAEK